MNKSPARLVRRILGVTFLFVLANSNAHVQMLLPDAGKSTNAYVHLDLRLLEHASQPGPLLPMGKPLNFGVIVNGRRQNLQAALTPVTVAGQPAFAGRYTMKEPGAHLFYLEPAPYWEPAEQVMVTHYAKVILNSCAANLPTESKMGWENWEGWDTLVGSPVEIEPLTQCTALWTGSAFKGRVRFEGKPAPSCRVEVEYLAENGPLTLPDHSFITQIFKTNSKGEFTFVPPRAGWWALTAIPESTKKVRNPEGRKVKAELGGVLWIRCVDMK